MNYDKKENIDNCVLKVTGVSKQFKNFQALSNVNVELEKGKIYGLIGKNGAGKTTLMRMICGLSFPTTGTIELFGSQSESDYKQELRRIGCLIEYPSMNPSMTAKENLRLHRIMRGIPNQKLDQELLEMVGLSDTKKKKVRDFSLGMRQRLGIAIAMISNPELLILDEPVNGLDPVGVVEIRNLIIDICKRRNITVLISSHNLPELYQTATDYIIIDKGEIKQTLTLEDLDERCRHHISIECDNPDQLTTILETKLHTKSYRVMQDKSIKLYDFLDERKMVMQTIYENGVIPTKFALEGDTLEKYFLSVIGGEDND